MPAAAEHTTTGYAIKRSAGAPTADECTTTTCPWAESAATTPTATERVVSTPTAPGTMTADIAMDCSATGSANVTRIAAEHAVAAQLN